MDKAITLVSCLIDMFIIKTYLDSMLGKIKKRSKSIGFLMVLTLTEILLTTNLALFVDVSEVSSTVISSVLSLVTTMLLCLFYTTNFKKIIFFSILFQIIVLISEEACILFEKRFIAKAGFLIDEKQYLYTMNFLSKIISLVIILVIAFPARRTDNKESYEYGILTFITPLFSMILLIFLPVDEKSVASNRSFYELFIIFIALLNIINNYFLKKLSRSHAEEVDHIKLTKQLDYQKEKYAQLSESYRRSRRIVHDTKKHYLEIQENIKRHDYQNLSEYLDSAITDLESTYVKYNTGSLVIDSLLTNCETISNGNHIEFNARLNVDNHRIPLNDYDFCIILGNLLDNCINACTHQTEPLRFIHIAICTTANDQFIIECENSYDAAYHADNTDDIYHGYGIANIQDTIEKYNGIFKIDKAETYMTTILIPITRIEQRTNPPYFR